MNGEALLELRGLTVNYGRGRRRPPDAVRDVSLTVAPGETVALVGESGSGKSTIGNVVLGLVPATGGSVRFDGEDITAAGRRRRRELTRHIQPIFQDPYGSLNPSRTIRQTLVEPLLAHGGAAGARERVAEVLSRVGLPPDAAERYPDEFSGGQRQRIAVARALVAGPRLIVCDEPTSALDLSVQAQVLNLLRGLQRESGIGYLFITHDLALIRHAADRVVVLYRGRVMETGPAARVTQQPQHPYTQALLAAAPVPDPVEQRRRRAVAGHLTRHPAGHERWEPGEPSRV
ncbi:ATP-binding cassette domain-containing protein [Dactylosporangium sp. CA-052675]|uniref:ATP-binding cassette domain-containing protein n=1 Tax=Dactylosporangium sp. CA-052675 TaxID=3239927 RepID=UPI003D8D53C2